MSDDRWDRVQILKVLQDPQGDTQRKELARRLLEALDTIDKAKALHQKQIVATWSSVFSEQCGECSQSWPCPTWQALGGNESGDDR